MTKQSFQLPDDEEGLKLMVHALVDGELDAAAALAMERHFATDLRLAALHRKVLALRAAVQGLPRAEVSEAFLNRISSIGAQGVAPTQQSTLSDAQSSPRRASNLRSWDWRALAASVAVTAVLSSGVTRQLVLNNAPDSFATAIADDHRRSLLAQTPFDVASSDRHTVKPWLDAKVGVSPPAPDLAASGFSLVGGRVEVIADKLVPALVYRHNEHLITLVAEPKGGGVASLPANRSTSGFSMVQWSDGTFSYWAISDLEQPELANFVLRFRSAVGGS
ncbi:MAG: anti-sigma factor [Aestuariivirga sp.]